MAGVRIPWEGQNPLDHAAAPLDAAVPGMGADQGGAVPKKPVGGKAVKASRRQHRGSRVEGAMGRPCGA